MTDTAREGAGVAAPATLRAALVRGVHGVQGELRVEPLGGDAARFRAGMRLRVEEGGRELRVRAARAGRDGSVLLSVGGIDTPEQAKELRGAYLCVDAVAARPLDEDEWFVWQLIGMRCVSVDGAPLGTIVDVEPAPAADILVIAARGTQVRYPMVREFVRGVDTEHGVMTIAPQPEDPV
ncbi:MAG: 16S rRNA processing protein RimM [Candidatus Dormibacteraeota bacterium]|nr:16S rRNA processing protein RimM [Candidatus Dormibacteraeota bacterium]